VRNGKGDETSVLRRATRTRAHRTGFELRDDESPIHNRWSTFGKRDFMLINLLKAVSLLLHAPDVSLKRFAGATFHLANF
jgi:hypothetical protein